MATYNINDLTIGDGKLYAGNIGVGARDNIQSMTQVIPKPSEGSMFDRDTPAEQIAILPAWSAGEEEVNGYLRHQWDRGLIWR